MHALPFVSAFLVMLASSAAAQAPAGSALQPPTGDARIVARSVVLRAAPASRTVWRAAPAPREAGLTVTPARSPRSGTLVGAAVGLVAGAIATYAVLHSGGSTSLCDRSANQDAMSSGECAGLVALGGAAGAGLGALIGSRIGR